jgi:hypothetical protein
MSSLYYEEISDVKELEDVSAVNDHIHNGWVLLKIADRSKTTYDPATTLPVQEVGVVYILGLRTKYPTAQDEQAVVEKGMKKQSDSVAQDKKEVTEGVPITVEHLGQLPWKASAYGEWIFTNAERHTKPTLSNFQKRIHAWLLQQCPMNQSKTFEGSDYIYKTDKDFITRNQKPKG